MGIGGDVFAKEVKINSINHYDITDVRVVDDLIYGVLRPSPAGFCSLA